MRFASEHDAREFLKKCQTLSYAVSRFARSGFAPTPPNILAAREATCRVCPEWDAAALNATGRCRKCGCSTWAKLRMATESCPLGKWSAFDNPPKTEPTTRPAQLKTEH